MNYSNSFELNMKEQVNKIIENLNTITTKFSDIRDLFWLKIDRYKEEDLKKGVEFDKKYAQQCSKLSRSINTFSKFIEKSFEPSEDEIARDKAIQKLKADYPNFEEWNVEAKDALIERETDMLLKSKSKVTRKGITKRNLKEELDNIDIANGDEFSDDFLAFYNSLDPSTSTHNSQKFIVRKYLVEKGYDKSIVSSLKINTTKSASRLLQVTFPDGTVLQNDKAVQTFLQAIEKIGVDKVCELKMETLVRADENFERTAQIVQMGNCYINTHSSTAEKKRQLDAVSRKLNLNLLVEVKEK